MLSCLKSDESQIELNFKLGNSWVKEINEINASLNNSVKNSTPKLTHFNKKLKYNKFKLTSKGKEILNQTV